MMDKIKEIRRKHERFVYEGYEDDVHNTIAFLISEIDRLQAEVQRLREIYEKERELSDYWKNAAETQKEYNILFLQQRDKLIEVLQWYSKDDQYTIPHVGCSPRVNADRGKRAREALKEIGLDAVADESSVYGIDCRDGKCEF